VIGRIDDDNRSGRSIAEFSILWSAAALLAS